MATMTLGQPGRLNLLEPWRKRHAPLVLGLVPDQAVRNIERLKCIINHVLRNYVLQ